MNAIAPDAALLEQRMQSTFGVTRHEYKRERARGPVSRAYLNNAIRIVDNSGVVPKLLEWRNMRLKSNAGVKPTIPFRAVLVLFLLHIQLGYGINYYRIADTLDVHFGDEEFALLGIQNLPGDRDDWYQRLWRSANRMMKLIDPYPGPRNKRLKSKPYAKLLAKQSTPNAMRKTERNLARLDWLCEQLLHTSVRMLPSDIWDKYHGNIAADATLIQGTGRPNPTNPNMRRGNADPQSGRYRRQGNHDGQGAKTDKAGYELEISVMVWNKPGQNTLFPSLVTAVGFHRPGELIGAGAKLVDSHQRLGFTSGLVIVDRAYNGEKSGNFQIPLRLRGCELVVDYKKTDLGLQNYWEDLILVEGNWYVTWMPENLIDAAKNYNTRVDNPLDPTKPKRMLDKESYRKFLKNRDAYRMKPKGRPDKDGFQRFIYPKPGYMAYDRATGKRVPNPVTRATVTIPLDAGSPAEKNKDPRLAVKHLQKFAFKSSEHRQHFGMRSLVESANKTLKSKNFEDLANVSKRSGRGFAFNYLAATLAAVSSNLRKIFDFFVKAAERESGQKLSRERRRKEATGTSLTRHSTLPALAPPQ
ncbi:hypothetical protein E3T54_13175 [Cryobacterium sp. Sr8]|uniref:hypothetical protein n=1 Tax=Cryobacterium sp. Sr8 TaxID=1259203 RepID=UPI00106CC3FE|nr:hypothetical protein [Cryobacterium sp. Sr8]TFD74895.1 hypothetical protein E3T54_13175 [Cryobacterium sp. Sr8]